MKTIKINHEQAQDIIYGSKMSTWRMFDEKHLSVGDEVQFIDKVDDDDEGTWVVIGTGVINKVVEKRLKDLTQKDYDLEQRVNKLSSVIEEFKKYYGPLVDESTPVKIIHFSFNRIDSSNANVVAKSSKITDIRLYTDGGSRGNPGPSALGFVIKNESDEILYEGSKYLGITTNNQAEYQAVKAGLEECSKFTNNIVSVYLDSQLVANQMNGIYKIKNRELWPIHQSIRQIIEKKFDKVTFTYVPREFNKEADAQVNKALDEYQNSK